MQIEKLENLPNEILGNWKEISKFQKLSENFMRDHQDKVDWTNISHYQKLSEDFISEFQDRVDWWDISKYQKLSEDFIRNNKDKVSWVKIKKYQKLSEGFIKEFSLVLSEFKILKVAHYCGDNNRPIYITKNNPTKVVIGCSSFTKEEAIEAINKKYNGEERQEYIDKINECFNLK